jgi:Family of unknown function (DUF6445)
MKLAVNPKLHIELVHVAEGQACAVIDDFLLNPEAAVTFACDRSDRFEAQERAYPGLVLPVGNTPLEAVNRFIQTELSRLFNFCRGGITFHSQLSLTMLQPDQFTWIQRLCHTDPRLEPGRMNLAALLYLFKDPELGGTGFYRWKEPEFWREMTSLQRDDPDAGLDVLRERFEMFRQPARYMTESNEAAELLDVAPAKFNRLIFYSGELPHSAHITHPERLSADPQTGRLTLNWFVSAIPKR